MNYNIVNQLSSKNSKTQFQTYNKNYSHHNTNNSIINKKLFTQPTKSSQKQHEKQAQTLIALLKNLSPTVIKYIQNLQNQNTSLFHHVSFLQQQLQLKSSQAIQLNKKVQTILQQKYKNNQNQNQFILQCEQQIQRLKNMVNMLVKQKEEMKFYKDGQQRQEIKDRIIMKLEDQLITAKLLLQEERQKNSSKRKNNPNDMLITADRLNQPLRQRKFIQNYENISPYKNKYANLDNLQDENHHRYSNKKTNSQIY